MSDLESKLQELIQIWMDAEQKAGGAVGLAFRACANALEKALADTKRQPNQEAVDDSDLALLEARRGGPTVPWERVRNMYKESAAPDGNHAISGKNENTPKAK